MTEKEVQKRCTEICNTVDQTTAVAMIEEEFKGCNVRIKMKYGQRGMKMFMGMIMWEDINTTF